MVCCTVRCIFHIGYVQAAEFSPLLNQLIISFSAAGPKLYEVTPDLLDSFTSRSAPVIARAQQCHNEEMRRLKLPWWKKLWDEDAVEGPGGKPGAEEQERLNF